jgi:hypothetical protein
MLDVRDFLRLVLDPLRLAVLGRAAEGPVDVEQIASTHNRPVREVQEAVGRLRAAGLLDTDLELDRGALREIAASLPHSPPVDPDVFAAGSWSAEEADVLSRFISGTRLVEIPASRSKRVVVLERLAQEFEPGVRYEEPEVNLTLQLWHPDYAALRRYLVDEGLMTRADGVYWRTGGRFEPEVN